MAVNALSSMMFTDWPLSWASGAKLLKRPLGRVIQFNDFMLARFLNGVHPPAMPIFIEFY